MTTDHTSIRPLQDQILVRRDSEDRVTAGGLHIPEVADNPKLPRGRGVVLAVGPGLKRGATIDVGVRELLRAVINKHNLGVSMEETAEYIYSADAVYEPMTVKVGDRVVFSKLSGDKVKDDLGMIDVDDDLLLIRESEVIAVLEADDAT